MDGVEPAPVLVAGAGDPARMDEAERKAIMAELPARLAAMPKPA